MTGVEPRLERAMRADLRLHFCRSNRKIRIVWLALSQGAQTIKQAPGAAGDRFLHQPRHARPLFDGTKLAKMPASESIGPVRQTLFPALSRMKGDPGCLRMAHLASAGAALHAGFSAQRRFRRSGGTDYPSPDRRQKDSGRADHPGPDDHRRPEVLENSTPLAMAVGRTKALFKRNVRVFTIRIRSILAGAAVGYTTPVGTIMGVIYGHSFALLINVVWNMQLIRSSVDLSLAKQAAVGIRPGIASAIMMMAVDYLRCSLPVSTTAPQEVATLLALVGFCGILYLTTMFSTWFIQGRPEGPEREIFGLIRRFAPGPPEGGVRIACPGLIAWARSQGPVRYLRLAEPIMDFHKGNPL